jgi:hypothetical protein
VAAASVVGAFAVAVASAVRAFEAVASAEVDFAQLESAAGAGRPAASLAPGGERPEVAGEQLQVAQAGARQDGVQGGADDGRDIDPAGDTVRAGVIAGPGTARQVSALRARRTMAATIHMTTAMDMTIATRFGNASGTGTYIASCG